MQNALQKAISKTVALVNAAGGYGQDDSSIMYILEDSDLALYTYVSKLSNKQYSEFIDQVFALAKQAQYNASNA